MSEELLPITEADVVVGAEFVMSNGRTARVEGIVCDIVVYSTVDWERLADYPTNSYRMGWVINNWRKRAPKPERHVVELRPPKKGERFFNSVNPRLVSTADYDFSDYALRWVIVDGDA